MPARKEHVYGPATYFITFTNYKWLALFAMTDGYDLVYKWFDYLKANGHYIVGYVIMPNHLHAVIAFGKSKKSINKIVGDAKRFLAYGIVERLQAAGKAELLEILHDAVINTERARGKKHEVFESSFDMKICYAPAFIEQKLIYMHANPVSKKWNLVHDSIDYPHSSALYYATGMQGIYPVVSYNDLDLYFEF
jgi:hypothetical protein